MHSTSLENHTWFMSVMPQKKRLKRLKCVRVYQRVKGKKKRISVLRLYSGKSDIEFSGVTQGCAGWINNHCPHPMHYRLLFTVALLTVCYKAWKRIILPLLFALRQKTTDWLNLMWLTGMVLLQSLWWIKQWALHISKESMGFLKLPEKLFIILIVVY